MPSIDVSVTAGSQDGHWYTDGSGYSNSDNFMGPGAVSVDNKCNAFMLFDPVNVPAGATITVCYADTKSGGGEPGVALKCCFENADDPAACSSATDANGRSCTSAIAWDVSGNADLAEYHTPELKTILQTVIDRAGWHSGQAVQLFIKDNGSSAGYQYIIMSYETPGAVSLHIEYTEGGIDGIEESESISVTDTPTISQNINMTRSSNMRRGVRIYG